MEMISLEKEIPESPEKSDKKEESSFFEFLDCGNFFIPAEIYLEEKIKEDPFYIR